METVIDVAVDAALCACWDAARSVVGGNNSHDERETDSPSDPQKVWNMTWDGALVKAKSIVQHIQEHSHPNAARDRVWDTIWEAWNSGFEDVRDHMRDATWKTMDEATDAVIDAVGDAVHATLPETHSCAVHMSVKRAVRVVNTLECCLWLTEMDRRNNQTHLHLIEVPHAQLQAWVHKAIKAHSDKVGQAPANSFGSSAAIQKAICETMGRVWEAVLHNRERHMHV